MRNRGAKQERAGRFGEKAQRWVKGAMGAGGGCLRGDGRRWDSAMEGLELHEQQVAFSLWAWGRGTVEVSVSFKSSDLMGLAWKTWPLFVCLFTMCSNASPITNSKRGLGRVSYALRTLGASAAEGGV